MGTRRTTIATGSCDCDSRAHATQQRVSTDEWRPQVPRPTHLRPRLQAAWSGLESRRIRAEAHRRQRPHCTGLRRRVRRETRVETLGGHDPSGSRRGAGKLEWKERRSAQRACDGATHIHLRAPPSAVAAAAARADERVDVRCERTTGSDDARDGGARGGERPPGGHSNGGRQECSEGRGWGPEAGGNVWASTNLGDELRTWPWRRAAPLQPLTTRPGGGYGFEFKLVP